MEKIINFIKNFNINNIPSDVKNAIDSAYINMFIGSGKYYIIYVLLLIFIFCIIKKDEKDEEEKEGIKKKRLFFGIYGIIIFVLALNKLYAYFYIKVTGGEYSTYWRVFWMFPVTIGIAYILAECIKYSKDKLKQILSLILIIVMLNLSGVYIYSEANFQEVHNSYKLPDDLVDVVEYISKDDKEYKKLAGPEEFLEYTRLIDGNIILAEGRHMYNPLGGENNCFLSLINNKDYATLKQRLIPYKINYLVFPKGYEENSGDNIENYGLKLIYQNNSYMLYYFDIDF